MIGMLLDLTGQTRLENGTHTCRICGRMAILASTGAKPRFTKSEPSINDLWQ